MGASVIEYDGFLTAFAAALTPAVRYDTRDLSLAAQANWTVFETGNQVFQGTAAAAWLSPSLGSARLELSGAAGASRYADEGARSHLLARARLHVHAASYGGWFGATTGASSDSITVSPMELTIGAWTVRNRFALVGTLTNTILEGDRYVDITGAARWNGERAEIDARVGTRAGIATTTWAEVAAVVPIRKQIALEISGGSYPADPVRRLLGARYGSVGLRLGIGAQQPDPIMPIARDAKPAGGVPYIEIAASGSLQTVRVHAADATVVEIMADFTDWQPIKLVRSRSGRWETQLPITRGVHRVNVRIDGGEWIVPGGARAEHDEFGSVVGVLIVP